MKTAKRLSLPTEKEKAQVVRAIEHIRDAQAKRELAYSRGDRIESEARVRAHRIVLSAEDRLDREYDRADELAEKLGFSDIHEVSKAFGFKVFPEAVRVED